MKKMLFLSRLRLSLMWIRLTYTLKWSCLRRYLRQSLHLLLSLPPVPEPVYSHTQLNDAVSPSAGSLKELILSVFGDYEPRTQTIETTQGDQVTTQVEIIPGVAGVDWPWLAGVLVFSIAFYGFFRILGVLIRG